MDGHTKRHMSYAVQPSEPVSSDTAKLATLGMRIRKSVADGHARAGSHTYNSQFFNSYSKFDEPRDASHDKEYNQFFSQQNFQRPQRVALPNNMSQPPALTSDGSTFQSGSNVSEWGAPSLSTMNLPSAPSLKRKMSDDMSRVQSEQIHSLFPSYDEFTAQNGQLSFNEEF